MHSFAEFENRYRHVLQKITDLKAMLEREKILTLGKRSKQGLEFLADFCGTKNPQGNDGLSAQPGVYF